MLLDTVNLLGQWLLNFDLFLFNFFTQIKIRSDLENRHTVCPLIYIKVEVLISSDKFYICIYIFVCHIQEFQKALGSKHSVYDTTARTGRALKDRTSLQDDNQKLDDMLSELRDKWDTVCGKSIERYEHVSPMRVRVMKMSPCMTVV